MSMEFPKGVPHTPVHVQPRGHRRVLAIFNVLAWTANVLAVAFLLSVWI
jgi:hypothetical protein